MSLGPSYPNAVIPARERITSRHKTRDETAVVRESEVRAWLPEWLAVSPSASHECWLECLFACKPANV